jgi:hypothetical protein
MDITKKIVLTLSVEECNIIKFALAKCIGLTWEQVNPVICDFDKQIIDQLKPKEEEK